jgi:hypothetical protein
MNETKWTIELMPLGWLIVGAAVGLGVYLWVTG